MKEGFGRRSIVERAMRWLKERLMGSLLLRSENLKYIEGMIKLVYFLKLAELSCQFETSLPFLTTTPYISLYPLYPLLLRKKLLSKSTTSMPLDGEVT